MARRHSRHGSERRPRRFAVFSLALLAVLGAAAWLAPAVAVLTSLRDRPLAAALAGIAGSVSSGSARWAWLGPIEFRDVVLRDAAGRAMAIVPELVIDRGLVHLALSPRDLGTIRLVGPEAVVEVRPGGSSLEDLFAPWLATPAAAAPALTLEVVDGVVEFVDLPRGDSWRVADLFAAVALDRGGTPGGWTVGGRLRHAGGPRDAAGADAPTPARRLDRSTVAAGAAAALAHAGGFSCSCSCSGSGGADGPVADRTVTVTAHQLPLGASSVAATRFGSSHVADGLADVRLDVTLDPGGARVEGVVEARRLAVCRADTLAEVLAIDAVDVPVDLAIADGRVVVTKLAARSRLFRAEASGRIRLPETGTWDWIDGLAGDDFAIAADVDLAAVARGLSGGLVVRDDVRVTGGHVEIAAAARADGDARVLEVRAAARDLAADQSVVDATTGQRSERPLRWTEPFAGWLRARCGVAGGLRIEEARVTSGALEVTGAADAGGATVQWTFDAGKLVAEAAEVVDFAGATLKGTSRGRIELSRPTATGPSRVRLVADLEDVEVALPGRPTWRDEQVSIEAETTCRLAAGTAHLEGAHAVVTSGDDVLEATLAGAAAIDLAGLSRGTALVPVMPAGRSTAADVTLAGDLGRWHARLAPLLPRAAGEGVEIGGRVKAALAAVARDDAWEITRAGAEVERMDIVALGRRVVEPRLVASAAGVVRPAAGRIDLASAEVLTATVSLRTAGLAWRSAPAGTAGGWRDRLRGRVQWQADVGRLERWLVAPETCGRWPAAGRAWGTLELVDGADTLDIVVEATGSQLALAEVVAAAPAAPRPVWAEPQATLVVELAVPPATPDTVRIDRLALESSTLAVQARGTVGGRPRAFDLDGTLAYDWQQVSRVLAPWTGGLVQLAGAGGRPFALRGRLPGDSPHVAPAPAAPDLAAIPLPEDWVAAARGGGGTEAPVARVTRPVAVAARGPAGVEILRSLAVDTSVAWQAGDVAGFPLAAGEVPVRLLDGQLAFGPFDVGVAGGRVRGAPWMALATEPREIVVPGGRAVERVAVGGQPVRRLVAWLSPLVGNATQASGFVSVDLAGARLPLSDPFAGVAEGQVTFEALEVTPDPSLKPLATLVAKLQALIDPRLAFGDAPVLMRVRPDPVHVRLVERRLWHEGLVIDSGPLTVKSSGSVGADGTLAMVVEVALRGDIVGQTPVVAQLLRTPLAIPLTGTVERPQFDARAIDMILARIVENTAQAVIGDGLARGLEALAGMELLRRGSRLSVQPVTSGQFDAIVRLARGGARRA
ncbi:MAG: hypothetical protein ACKOSQ_12720 [Planctomycetaceae bacterium]